MLVAWLALLRSIGPRPTPTPGEQNMQGRRGGMMGKEREDGKHAPNPPIWPEAVLNCLSEREAGLGVGGTPWVKE